MPAKPNPLNLLRKGKFVRLAPVTIKSIANLRNAMKLSEGKLIDHAVAELGRRSK